MKSAFSFAIILACQLPLFSSPLVEVDFATWADTNTDGNLDDGERTQDVSGNGYHGFWGSTTGNISFISTSNGPAIDTSGSAYGKIFLRDELTGIPDAWDGPATTVTPYFTFDGTQSYTFEAVVNWNNSLQALNGLMGQIGGNELWIRENGGYLQYAFVSGAANASLFTNTIDISAAKTDSQWHAIAVVYDATAKEIRTYLDGTLKHTNIDTDIGTLGTMVNGVSDFSVGAYNGSSGNYFDGLQKHYRISTGALAPEEFLPVPLDANSPPVAGNVAIQGIAAEGETLTGTYDYGDAQGDAESGTTFKWYRSSDMVFDPGDTEIPGAQFTSYTLQPADDASFIFFEVTPAAATGASPGIPAHSIATAQVNITSPFPESIPFISGVGYPVYRIPAMVRANDGTLLAFCEGRASISDSGNIDIVLRRSTDNGNTWGPLIVAQDDGANTIGNPAPVVDRTTGHIHMLFCRNNQTVFHTVSTDSGLTWSARTEITANVKLPTWGWYATGPCHGDQLTRGTQAGRLVVPANHAVGTGNADTANKGAQILYSDDHGATWHMDAYFETSFSGAAPNETTLVELNTPGTEGGSHLYINSRDYDAAPGNRSEAWSGDGGSSYSVPYATNPHFVTPVVQGSLARFSATDEGDAVNRIIFSCPNGGSRTNGSLWISYDEAATWSQAKPLFPENPGDYAYSDMAMTTSGELGILFETNSYGAIKFIRVSEEWIDAPPPSVSAPQSALWLFEEKEIGNTVDLTPGAILDSQPAGNALHLTANSASLAYIAGTETNSTALAFDDSGGLSIADGASEQAFDFGPDDHVTFEARVLIPSTGASLPGAIIAKNQQPGGEYWIRVQTNGTVTFLWDDAGTELSVSSSTSINDDQWHHVAAVRDADSHELRIYIDGTLEGSTADTTTGNIANSVPLSIGAFTGTTGRNLVGSIDWVAITNAALAPGGFVSNRLCADADIDGLPDADEMTLTGNLTTLGAGDSDGDSQSDLLELALGSNPTSSADLVNLEVSADPARVFAYQRRSDIPWIRCDEQFGDTLSSWGPLPGFLDRTTNPLIPGFEEIVFSSLDLPTNQFFRVSVQASFP